MHYSVALNCYYFAEVSIEVINELSLYTLEIDNLHYGILKTHTFRLSSVVKYTFGGHQPSLARPRLASFQILLSGQRQ